MNFQNYFLTSVQGFVAVAHVGVVITIVLCAIVLSPLLLPFWLIGLMGEPVESLDNGASLGGGC